MANRHKATGRFAKGGKVKDTVEKDHEEMGEAHKTGGAVKLKTGGAAPAPKLKTGGKVAGFNRGGRLDKRARGGGVGADRHPFSSAHLK